MNVNRIHFLAVASLILLLGACGGGGGTSSESIVPVGPTIPPSTAAPYTVALTYKGGLEPNGTTVQIAARPMSDAAPTPVPIMLVAPDSVAPAAQFGPGVTSALVTANVQPSPSPPVSSAPAWSVSSTDVSLDTPAPSNPASLQASVSVPLVATTGNCMLSITIGSPVNATQSIPCYVYPRLTLWCPHADPSGERVPSEVMQGVAFDANGNAVAQSNPATSDAWVDGPNCYGAFSNPSEPALTLHFAGGGTAISGGWTSLPFYTVTAAQYADTAQAFGIDTSVQGDIFVFRDSLGRAVKFEPNIYAFDTSVNEGKMSGGFQVQGDSVDGF